MAEYLLAIGYDSATTNRGPLIYAIDPETGDAVDSLDMARTNLAEHDITYDQVTQQAFFHFNNNATNTVELWRVGFDATTGAFGAPEQLYTLQDPRFTSYGMGRLRVHDGSLWQWYRVYETTWASWSHWLFQYDLDGNQLQALDIHYNPFGEGPVYNGQVYLEVTDIAFGGPPNNYLYVLGAPLSGAHPGRDTPRAYARNMDTGVYEWGSSLQSAAFGFAVRPSDDHAFYMNDGVGPAPDYASQIEVEEQELPSALVWGGTGVPITLSSSVRRAIAMREDGTRLFVGNLYEPTELTRLDVPPTPIGTEPAGQNVVNIGATGTGVSPTFRTYSLALVEAPAPVISGGPRGTGRRFIGA